MSENKPTVALTDKERKYLDCSTPMLEGSSAALRLSGGILLSMLRAVAIPSSEYSKADSKVVTTLRHMKYTKYKKAVLRKLHGESKKSDEKLLKKLNDSDFVLSEETYDPDEFTRQVYEEYLKMHPELQDESEDQHER